MFFGVELCGVVRYHMPGVALYGMVSYVIEWGRHAALYKASQYWL